jgi:DNA-binding GntR family transcriptional regulator
MPNDLTVTRHPPIRDQIAQILRNAIVNLDFTPGSILIERARCELTGASRPSVREALRQLEAEGLVDSRNGRGTIVRTITPDEASALYEVRAELEGFAVRLFCERASADDRRRLRESAEKLQAAARASGDSRTVLAAQGEFYGVIFAGAGNPFLVQTIGGIQDRVAQLRAVTLAVPGRAERSTAEFAEIARLIEEGDSEGAQREAVLHVSEAESAMRRAMAAAEEAAATA